MSDSPAVLAQSDSRRGGRQFWKSLCRPGFGRPSMRNSTLRGATIAAADPIIIVVRAISVKLFATGTLRHARAAELPRCAWAENLPFQPACGSSSSFDAAAASASSVGQTNCSDAPGCPKPMAPPGQRPQATRRQGGRLGKEFRHMPKRLAFPPVTVR